MPGATTSILRSLRDHGLFWDGEVLQQSQRHNAYQAAVDRLIADGRAYRCRCSRADISAMGGVYDGRCRSLHLGPEVDSAVRLNVSDMPPVSVEDAIQSPLHCDLDTGSGDFVIKRRDGLFAYQLAVVLDDAYQGITDVIRGSDLYDSTPRQIALQRHLMLKTPGYAHLPVLCNAEGQKLSKQTHAAPVEAKQAVENLRLALRFLAQPDPPCSCRNIDAVLKWAVTHWSLDAIPKTMAIPAHSLS